MIVFESDDLLEPTADGKFRRMVSETSRIRAGMLGFAPGETFQMHAHAESAEIFYFITGQGTIRSGIDGERAVASGDLVVLEPGEMHVFRAGPDGLVVLAVVAPNLDDGILAEQDESSVAGSAQ